MKKFLSLSLEKQLYFLGWILLPVAFGFYFAVTKLSLFRNLPCSFFLATGFFCPGCGATRSLYLLLHGRLLLSFLYYPAVPYCAGLYLWFMFSHTLDLLFPGRISIGLPYRSRYLYIALVLILGNFLIKNLLLIL